MERLRLAALGGFGRSGRLCTSRDISRRQHDERVRPQQRRSDISGSITASNWLGWANLSDFGLFGVGACSSSPNRIDLVTVGVGDRALYYKYWDGSSWNGWFKEDVCASAPVIVSRAQNTGDVFVLGDDHGVYHKSFR